MTAARHKRDPDVEGLSLEEIMQRYVGRFADKTPDWAAFEDAKIEGYKRAQHRFIGAGGSGSMATRPSSPRAVSRSASCMSSPAETPRTRVEEVFFVLQGQLSVFVEDENGRRLSKTLGPWECISCPPGVIHGYQNESSEPVYFQVMLGRARPETMGYADDSLYQRRDAHLKM